MTLSCLTKQVPYNPHHSQRLEHFMNHNKQLVLTFDTNCQFGGGSANAVGGPDLIGARVLSHGLQDVQGTEAEVIHGPAKGSHEGC